MNIDDCAASPCLHLGICQDGVNMYTCDCTDTGFTGDNCEIDIDECASSPCRNEATCINEINDYTCQCWPGYTDKNCETDVRECEAAPCQNNGTCYERSDLELYKQPRLSTLPPTIREAFALGFHYENASGYLCLCLPGLEGKL